MNKKRLRCGKTPKYNLGKLNGNPNGNSPWLGMIQGSALPLEQKLSPYAGGTSGGGSKFNMTNEGAFNLAGSAANFAGSMVNSFASPELTGSNKTYQARGPIQYTKTDYVSNKTELDALKKQNSGNALNAVGSGAGLGAAIGSVVPGVGTVIGGAVGGLVGGITSLFGGNKRKRKLRKAIRSENDNITNRNQFNLADAHSGIVQQEYYDENEDTQDDILFNKGKTPKKRKCNNGKSANALVGKGETIVDGNTGNLTEVTSGSAIGTDDVPANINDEDAVAGNLINPRTGQTFAEDMKPLTRMENRLKRNKDRNIRSIADSTEQLVRSYTQPMANTILQEQAMVQSKVNPNNLPTYDKGKSIIGYASQGFNALTALAPSIWNSYQGAQQTESTIPDELYASNAYAQPALNTMAKRRYNAAPEMDALRNLEKRQRYSTRSLGSEGGINRAIDVAGALNVAREIGNTYSRKQNVDNEYLAQEAAMMAQLGSQDADNKSAAMKASYDINAKNRATRKAYQDAALTGFSNYAQQRKLNSNRGVMDDAKLRVLQQYYGMGADQATSDYILSPLLNR